MCTSRAAVLRAFGAPQAVEEITLREPGPFEARVRLTAAGVCHSDVGQADGEWGAALPLVLGHEGAGVVEAVGPGVDVPVGTRVMLNMAPGCGRCHFCAIGRPILCQAALDAMSEARLLTGDSPISGAGGRIGAYALLACFARHAVVQARSLVPLPDDVPDKVGALMGCAVITGAGAALETIDIAAGSRGAVIGAGGVGVNAIQAARAQGAAEVVAVDPAEERLEWARRFGATGGLDPRDTDTLGRMAEHARHDGFDWTIVTVGNPDAMRTGVELLRPGGVACMVGLAPENRPVPVDMLELVTFEKRVVGSAYGTLALPALLPRLIEMYRGGLLALDELAADRFPLEGINDAFAISRAARGLRPVLDLAA